MRRTVCIRLEMMREESQKLLGLREAYLKACNRIVPYVIENRCWNRVALQHLVYKNIREGSSLGSQMVCNAIFSVCKAYKNRTTSKGESIPTIRFHAGRSVHFDKRTYSIKGKTLSLYTLDKRITVLMRMGAFQSEYFSQGVPKEGELIFRKGKWYFNLVLDLPDPTPVDRTAVFAIDLGENVLAASSSGQLFGGGKIRCEKDKYLAKRRRPQSNGSQSAKQLLKKISGREGRWVKQINHEVSKAVIQEAIQQGAGVIVLEDLTHIRKRIKAGKKVRSRLHRWSFRQFQTMVEYKAQQRGLSVAYVNPDHALSEQNI